MPKLEYFAVAESVSIDQLTNRLSLFNVYDEIFIPKFPVKLASCVAVCAWNFEEGDKDVNFHVSVKIKTLDGEKTYKSNFTMKSKRHRSILDFSGMPVSKPGSIEFDLMMDGTHQASHTIIVHQIEVSESSP